MNSKYLVRCDRIFFYFSVVYFIEQYLYVIFAKPAPSMDCAPPAYFLLFLCVLTLPTDGEAVWGTAYDFFGGGEAGMRACRAIGALAAVGQIDTTITTFLVPLQVW